MKRNILTPSIKQANAAAKRKSQEKSELIKELHSIGYTHDGPMTTVPCAENLMIVDVSGLDVEIQRQSIVSETMDGRHPRRFNVLYDFTFVAHYSDVQVTRRLNFLRTEVTRCALSLDELTLRLTNNASERAYDVADILASSVQYDENREDFLANEYTLRFTGTLAEVSVGAPLVADVAQERVSTDTALDEERARLRSMTVARLQVILIERGICSRAETVSMTRAELTELILREVNQE